MSQRYQKSEQLLQQCLKSIPLASQTFSKSITQYPLGASPLFIESATGSRVWDVDGNEYIDFVNALLAVSIGYNNKIITRAVQEQLQNGVTFSLPHRLEMQVAELLIDMIPCAEMVRFGKNGSDATTAAIRLARHYTQREHIAVCGYHGWQDWYIGSTSRDEGVPATVKALTHTFQYNNIDSLQNLFKKNPEQLAAVIMEPMNTHWPDSGFLQQVRQITVQHNSLLIFDETITGCRFSRGGAQELFDVIPDLTTVGKGIANGFPLSAVLGRREIMQHMQEVFFSTTFGGETLSLAAAQAVLTLIRDGDVIEKLNQLGTYLIQELSKLIKQHNVEHIFSLSGHPSWSFLHINSIPPYSGLEIKTLLLQELFKQGVLCIGSHNLSYAHQHSDIDYLLQAYEQAFLFIKPAIEEQKLYKFLDSEPLQALFKVR